MMEYLNSLIKNNKYESCIVIKNSVISFSNVPEYVKMQLLIEVTELLIEQEISHFINKNFEIVLT